MESVADEHLGIEVVLLMADAEPGADGAPVDDDILAEDLERVAAQGGESVNHADGGVFYGAIGAEDAKEFASKSVKAVKEIVCPQMTQIRADENDQY